MSNPQDAKLRLKLVLNKQKTKVLFAEADNHFADTLLSFLTLPLGKLHLSMQYHYVLDTPNIGSINSLHRSLFNLDSSYFSNARSKQMLIYPESRFSYECSMMKLDVTDNRPMRYFACQDNACFRIRKHIISSSYCSTTRMCQCGKAMSKEVSLLKNAHPDGGGGGAFMVNKSTFLITDDLKIFPNVTASLVQIASELGIEAKDWGERMYVTFGRDEVMDLLKATIFSLTPLTYVVLHRGSCGPTIPATPRSLSHKIGERPGVIGRYCVLKAIIQKSTNKLLFVESDEQFVDFLFSLLAVPLGGIEHCLGGTAPFLKNINNLYRSVNGIDRKYFESDHIKTKLTQLHILPHGYKSCHQILFPRQSYLTEHEAVYHFVDPSQGVESEYVSRSRLPRSSKLIVSYDNNPKLGESYVRRSGTFKITDDLTVTPLSALDGLNVPLSDVAEQEVTIQVEQAFSILMASLTSRNVLSTVLGPMLMKTPKQEL